ncbi:MAG TPA: hypothetical protein VJI75_01215, partial [Candidatus Nanoarchaeia archaeon]|nr:hypothetical protein [Candidatus Nanoarchaeia archaeon]
MGKLEETKRISTKQPTTSQTAAPAQTQIHAEEELEELEEHEEVLEELEEHEEIKMPSLEEIAKGMEQEDKKIESSIIAGMNDLVFVELPYTYIMGLAGNAYRGFREFNHAIEVQREALMSPEFIKASNLLKSRGIESKGLIEDRIKGRENLDKARGRMATFYLLDAANPEMLKEDHTIKKMIESIELTPKFISRYQEKVLPKGQAELPDHLLIKEDEILTYTNFSCDKGFNDLKESGRLTDMMLQVHKKMQEAVTGSKRTLETPTGDYEPEPAAQDTKPANSAKKTLADIIPEKRTINMLI